MIYINNLNENYIQNDISFVLCDFDRTISKYDSATSWSIIPSSKYVDPKILEESRNLFDHYRPIELDTEMDFNQKSFYMKQWALASLSLYSKYKVTKNQLYKTLIYDNKIKLRKDFSKFVNRLNSLGIKLYIVSAGIYDIIEYILIENNILLDNVEIISNHLKYNRGIIDGVDGLFLHSCNKDKINLPITNNQYGLLFGDQVEDKMIAKKYNTLDIVFSDIKNDSFDITLSGNSSFDNVGKLLIKNYK